MYGKSLGIYVHIPFCDGKCNYCDFYSFKAKADEYDVYTYQITKKIQKFSELYTYKVVDTIYFGGGTPSVIGSDRIVKIIESIFKAFKIAVGCEITVEANPSSADNFDFSQLKLAGVNRVSLGMQSAVDEELKLLGRRHNRIDVINTVNRVIKSGIDNYSLDVMMGIPLQTKESLITTLEFCKNIEAPHISTYLLSVEPDTVFGRNFDKYKFADDDLQADLYSLCSDHLKSREYEHYEVSNFCKDNKFSRHNMRYWELKDYLGLGPSAHSLMDGKRFYYPRNILDFYDNKIIDDGVGNTTDEYIMLSLRTSKGIDIAELKLRLGGNLSEDFMRKIRVFSQQGYVEADDKSIKLTEKGFLMSNAIIAELI